MAPALGRACAQEELVLTHGGLARVAYLKYHKIKWKCGGI